MAEPIRYTHPRQWANASQEYTFPPIRLRDDTGQPLVAVSGLWLTLYDPRATDASVINGLNRLSIRNTARATFVEEQLLLHLNRLDTAPVQPTGGYEARHALIEYAYASGSKVQTIEIQFVIRHIARFPVSP